jgi:hypothetical protein
VLIVTVSLSIVCLPAPLGRTSRLTVPLVVNKVMSELTSELIVVLAVAAETTTVAPSTTVLLANIAIARLRFFSLPPCYLNNPVTILHVAYQERRLAYQITLMVL